MQHIISAPPVVYVVVKVLQLIIGIIALLSEPTVCKFELCDLFVNKEVRKFKTKESKTYLQYGVTRFKKRTKSIKQISKVDSKVKACFPAKFL